jgi:hypothetical protein
VTAISRPENPASSSNVLSSTMSDHPAWRDEVSQFTFSRKTVFRISPLDSWATSLFG